mgnify:CR=1 FL=1
MNHTLNILKRHPLSAAFPDMPADEFAELVEDIRKNGLLQPVVIHDEMVLDGWHRYRASLEAGVTPSFEPYDGPDPVSFVLSLNMHRRHLTGSQRAAAVVACHAWAPEGRPKQDTGCPVFTTREMAEEASVHPNTIKQAKAAHKAGLGEAVRDGKVTAKEAAQIAKLPEPERQAAIEAPPESKKAEPKAVPLEAQEYVSKLEAEVAELKDQLSELAENMTGLQEELEAARRILDAEDLLAQFKAEVARVNAMNATLKSRNFGLMDENSDLKGRLKSALRKIDRFEKAAKGAA